MENEQYRAVQGYKSDPSSPAKIHPIVTGTKVTYNECTSLIIAEYWSWCIFMHPPLIGRCIKRSFCLTSVAYIGANSRTERPRKTKIGTEVAHVTRDSDTTFKVKRSKVKVTRPLQLVVLAGQHVNTIIATYQYAYMKYIVSPLAGVGGGISWRPPAYSLLYIIMGMRFEVADGLRFATGRTATAALQ